MPNDEKVWEMVNFTIARDGKEIRWQKLISYTTKAQRLNAITAAATTALGGHTPVMVDHNTKKIFIPGYLSSYMRVATYGTAPASPPAEQVDTPKAVELTLEDAFANYYQERENDGELFYRRRRARH